MNETEEIRSLLSKCSDSQRREIFELLRQNFRIHPLEDKLNVRAEVILEAIDRASDLTLRGIRGIIAEAFFQLEIIPSLDGWRAVPFGGDMPYDFLLQDSTGQIRVQVKMQRLKDHRPMMASEGYRFLPDHMYVVETQRTRGGTDPHTNEDTRPYRFGDFDILAVSMHPSSNNWSRFMYTAANWLVPRPEDKRLLLKFQPVAKEPSETWTPAFETAVGWLRSGVRRKVYEAHGKD
jgi:hypothetical protein